jgi:hypothetical protein
MKKLGLLLFPLLAITLMLGGNAFAVNEGGDPSVYFVTYYSNAHTTGAPDATVRIINDGDQSTGTGECINFECGGNIWADIFVFDDSQELQECCSCEVTADGLLSESVNQNLTANTLTGRVPTRGVIKVISDGIGIEVDDTLDPSPGLRAWATHIQATSVTFASGKAPAEKSPFYVTETEFADSNLNAAELERLDNLCSFAITLGSGSGVCSCNYEDYEF